MAPADDRRAIGVARKECSLHGLVEFGRRIGLGAHPPLFEHDIALGRDDIGGQHQIGHPVGFVAHHRAQMFACDALKIRGVIVGGEGIFLAAEFGDELRKLALRVIRRALEHEMFEKMRNAGFAWRIVRRTVPVPDHMRDDRRTVIWNDHNVETVIELEILNAGRGRRHGIGRAVSQRRRMGGGTVHLFPRMAAVQPFTAPVMRLYRAKGGEASAPSPGDNAVSRRAGF